MAVNEERAAAGLPGLQWSRPLAAAAHLHAERMASANTMSHQLRGEPDLGERAAATGTRFPLLAENVGVGPSPMELHRALMDSPHHRENILDAKVNAIGIAVVYAHGSLWVVEDFAEDLPQIGRSDQEQAIAAVLQVAGLAGVAASSEARQMCAMSSGFVGVRPAFVMRYTTDNLQHVPDELFARLSQGGVSRAAVGTCASQQSTLYNVAIVLYR